MQNRVLLDTCALIWLVNGEHLAAEAKDVIETAGAGGAVFINPMSAWEVGMLASKGRLSLSMSVPKWFNQIIDHSAFQISDLNIAPLETDVWSHKQLLKVVSHTPVEVEALGATQDAGKWVDVTRQDIPEGNLYSWWSYRAKDWDGADKGRRLDHVWATPDISGAASGSRVLRAARGWEKPSDHAPVFATFDL